MAIMIDNISFCNYRQYGNCSLSFKTTGRYLLSAYVAQNGIGKTTLQNAITWCLYEKEYQLSNESDALPAINSSLLVQENIGRVISVSVSLRILDGSKVVEFKRVLPFKISRINDVVSAVPGFAKFTATITADDFVNTDIKEDTDADVLAKQYFDQAIYNFYFFDGEKLSEFFDAGRTRDIKQSIFNISQVTLLENTRLHVEKMRYGLSKKFGKGIPAIEELLKRKAENEEDLVIAERQKERSEQKLQDLRQEIEKYDELLRGHEPVKKLQNERLRLLEEMDRVENDAANYKVSQADFLRKYLTLVCLYPRMKKILDVIIKKEKDGDLPPAIDTALIKTVLDNPNDPCPLCTGVISHTGIQHLQDLLRRINVSSATSNNLKEIKGPLEEYLETVGKYQDDRDDLREKSKDIEVRKDKISKRLQEISSLLAGVEGSSDTGIDIASIEKKRIIAIENRDTENQSLGAAKDKIASCNRNIAVLLEELRKVEEKQKEFSEVQDQIAVLEMLLYHYQNIKDSIMTGMREEIAETTWMYFQKMIWKKNTFGKIEIDDSYGVSVYDSAGRKMTSSMSATEQMALAYAFTLAIHETSGKNCPIVIDSPLGRVSDENRINMAEALLSVSKEKQIIMLFTPDEFSANVQDIYANKTQIRKLVLTEDEKYIREVDS